MLTYNEKFVKTRVAVALGCQRHLEKPGISDSDKRLTRIRRDFVQHQIRSIASTPENCLDIRSN